MTDASRVKARTTVAAVLHAHGHSSARRGPCPIHGGDNRTAFSHDDQRWACWTHCGTGDVVRLVELLRGVGFRDALHWLEHFTGLRADSAPVRQDDFPDIGPAARAAWLADIDERWNAVRRWGRNSPYMDDLEDEWREARRMPGAQSIMPIIREVVRILRGE